MERIQVTTNFYLDEFIDPHTYFNSINRGADDLDKRLYRIAQLLRSYYGKPIGINNWWHYYQENKDCALVEDIIDTIEKSTMLWWAGARHRVFKWSGTRTERTGVGSPQSAHRLFKAIDPKGPAKELNAIVEKHPKEFYDLGVRRLEDYRITPGWLHLDTEERNTQPNSIRVIDLTSHVKTIRW